MREYLPSASFMCEALYKKGYTLIYGEMEYRYFVDYAFWWHIVTYAVKSGNLYLVILPNRRPDLMRKYIDQDYMTPYPEKYIYLGESCNDCLCSRCRMLDHCNIVERRTDFYCHNYCKGKGEPKKECCMHEPVTQMWLGDNCEYCWCSVCANIESCGIMEGNTRWNCINECKGMASWTRDCSQFERRKK